MGADYDLDRKAADEWFEHLEVELAWVELKTSSGKMRKAKAEEFMLMSESRMGNKTVIGFKHSHTRNYLYLTMDGSGKCSIHVPSEGTPFHHGEFDYPAPEELEAWILEHEEMNGRR